MDNNGIDAGNPEALPRSNPTIYNATCVGKNLPTRGPAITANCKPQNGAANCVSQALLLRQSTAGTLRNILIYRFAVGIDMDQPAGVAGSGLTLSPLGLCNQLQSGALTVRNVAISVGPTPGAGANGTASLATDPDGNDPGVTGGVAGDCASYTVAGGFNGSNLEAMFAADPANHITVYAAGDANGDYLVNPLDVLVPDFRPKPGAAIGGLAAATPPADGFFDASATYLGALPPNNGAGIPWYSGWTRGWTTSTTK
jgi:hypothetical protein